MSLVVASLLLAQAAAPPSTAEVVQAVRSFLSAADEKARAALPQPWKSIPPLRFSQPAPAGSTVTAEAKGNVLSLETNLAAQPVVLMLDDRLVDLDHPVTVTLNGATLVQQKCERKVETLLQTLLERGDPELVYSSWVQARPSK